MKALSALLVVMVALTPAFVLADAAGSDHYDGLFYAQGAGAHFAISGCTFIRNGSRHDAEDAASHMRLKYRRGKRYATTAELFIERLASKSSFSGKPYAIECPGSEAVPSGEWLTARLHEYRERQAATP